MVYHIEPVIESFIWGGRKIIDAYHLNQDLDQIGMMYHVIALKGHQDCIVREAGTCLSNFYKNSPELFHCNAAIFPLRLATSCNEKQMSYQLHPDNAYAMAHEGTMGKVSGGIPLIPDGTVSTRLMGNTAQTLEAFQRMVAEEDWEHLFQKMQVRSGQFVHTPAGVIHGGKGSGELTMVFATNSDITYRFFDFNRNDPNRKLHLQQVYDCVNIPEVPLAPIDPVSHIENNVLVTEYYAKPGEYVAKRLDVNGSGFYGLKEFLFLTCTKGEGTVNGVPLHSAETVFLPAGSGPVALNGDMQLYLISYIDE